MVHCIDFWKKWKKEPNFCGLGKGSAKSYDQYLQFVDEMASKYDIPQETIYLNAPATSVKPVLRFKKDGEIRQNAMKKIASTLKGKQAVTLKYTNTILGIVGEPKIAVEPVIKAEIASAVDKNTVSGKIRMINMVLSTGHQKVLQTIIDREGVDNEYEALLVALKWASEKLK